MGFKETNGNKKEIFETLGEPRKPRKDIGSNKEPRECEGIQQGVPFNICNKINGWSTERVHI